MRLIDADEFEQEMYHEAFETDSDLQKWDSGCWIRYKMFENAIENFQTVDAVPVKHGHWKGYRFPKYRGNDDFGEPIFKEYVAYTCSNCRKQNAIRHKYCPMCGALMDEVVTE